jgi:ribonuclease Z
VRRDRKRRVLKKIPVHRREITIMKRSKKTSSEGLTRRDLLKASGVAMGSLALGGAMVGARAGKALAKQQQQCGTNECHYPVGRGTTQKYSYPTHLSAFTPDMQPQLDEDEMRITFLGTAFPPARRAQEMMSIFVEVGPWVPDAGGGFGKATDSFVFDCGAGALTNYNAMGIAFSRMDKIFITHLHADHMSDLSAIYCFGPSGDRKWPLYVWGQSRSGITCPAWGNNPPTNYDDGLDTFCQNFRNAMRWHTESFSFLPTSHASYTPPKQSDWNTPCPLNPVPDDPPDDGFGLVPIELDWTAVGGVAYENPATGVKITHFPVIHTRKGSMGYKLKWNGLSMIYTSDTRPETVSIGQAGGVDVFIHEMILPPELLAMKNLGYPAPAPGDAAFDAAEKSLTDVEDSSHTPQGAFGYLLSQIFPRPRLTVIAHFPATDDTVKCAMKSVQAHFPKKGGYPEFGKDIIWSTDLMVLRVRKGKKGKPPQIEQLMGEVSDYTFSPPLNYYPVKLAKYSDPTDQLDTKNLILPDDTYCENGY